MQSRRRRARVLLSLARVSSVKNRGSVPIYTPAAITVITGRKGGKSSRAVLLQCDVFFVGFALVRRFFFVLFLGRFASCIHLNRYCLRLFLHVIYGEHG